MNKQSGTDDVRPKKSWRRRRGRYRKGKKSVVPKPAESAPIAPVEPVVPDDKGATSAFVSSELDNFSFHKRSITTDPVTTIFNYLSPPPSITKCDFSPIPCIDNLYQCLNILLYKCI